ncbi:MAG: valine--tRNA ligase [Niastella sp.]|nr:valine--tRNA ligase [Niastella sp.]
MELSKNFEPATVDAKWYSHWLSKGYFNSKPDGREPYSIVIPPPNVTGVLHMGHCLNNTIQDILIRTARMQGKNACWVPGTDHASIATEAKVVAMLREKGITKSSLSREAFLKYAWEWKEKYGGIILEQLKKLGCSPDWNRTSFTMDPDYYESVIKVFIDLYHKKLIYRGKRMVNWDPESHTALSDEEVIFKEVNSKLYFIQYLFADDSGNAITVATTRPETILGDVAICVNPNDDRYKKFIGKEVMVPIINRKIPIIADEYVTTDFGTGALKITPAHDKNDNMLGQKHSLKAIDTLDESGKFTVAELMDEKPGDQVMSYTGMDRFALRKKIIEDLSAMGQVAKTEEYKGQVGTSERTGAVIEHKLSMQWFINMNEFLAGNTEVLSSVMQDEITFHPGKLKNTYNHWLENIKDWCISRQLWWGQQIPAWYNGAGDYVVAANLEDAKEKFASEHPGKDNTRIKQDEDVLDTWFSSWLWPIEVFKGISHPGNEDFKYYYPTTTLVTGQDIIFFWVARMIMAAYEYTNTKPFSNVYFTGMVRDKQGRKMSKQLGNSPDLLMLIENYGADAVRFGIMIASPAGNDLLFDESSLEQGRNFNNKMWNALKLVKMWENRIDHNIEIDEGAIFAMDWFQNRLAAVRLEVDGLMKQFKLSEALKTLYSLIWDDFCSWYLEWVKPGYEQDLHKNVYDRSIQFFTELMQVLHPFMPFITEEIYHKLATRDNDICLLPFAEVTKPNMDTLESGKKLKELITGIRDVRNKQQVKPKEAISLTIDTANEETIKKLISLLSKQVNADSIIFSATAPAASITTVFGKEKIYIETPQPLNRGHQKDDLLKELNHLKGFLAQVEKKLSNEKFIQNARPEVLALEQKKKSDAEARIRIIEGSLSDL